METATETKPSILEAAWRLYAQFDAAAKKRQKAKNDLHISVALISILATLFAISSSIYPADFPAIGATLINIVLIILPILASTLAAFASKFFPGGDWLILRAGAELIQKEIFQYRTILQKKKRLRRSWLENRLRDIYLQVYNGLNGELILEPFTKTLPPGYDKSDTRADPGFADLSFEEYYEYRIKDQLDWHVRRVQRLQRDRVRMQIWILFAGGLGAFLAAMGDPFSIWVALTTALTTALIGVQEIRNYDKTVRNYSRVILELSTISNHWHNLEVTETRDERTKKEFYKMVQATETVLWNQFVEYIKSMQEVLATTQPEGADLINQTIDQQDRDDNDDDVPVNELLTPLTPSEVDQREMSNG